MKLLHLSDLHFGAHSEELATSLESWVRAQKPDVSYAVFSYIGIKSMHK